jgi:ribosomal protein S18 acetylase RimI-like enzyme
MSGVRLRRTRAADLPFVTALERHPDNRELIGQWSDALHLAAIAGDEGREHRIIERDGAPAGYMISYDGRAEYGGVYLKRILVADKERGTGLAALELFLEEMWQRPGVHFVWLCVRAANTRAFSLYRALGFRRFEPDADESARLARRGDVPGEDVLRMRLIGTPYRGRG